MGRDPIPLYDRPAPALQRGLVHRWKSIESGARLAKHPGRHVVAGLMERRDRRAARHSSLEELPGPSRHPPRDHTHHGDALHLTASEIGDYRMNEG
jgi:hypothetical protein